MKPNAELSLPAWLMRHLGCNADNEAILGDLEECHRRGRAWAWYWKQVAVSIAVSLCAQIRREPFRIFRGLMAAWLVYWPLGYTIFHFGFYELGLVSLRVDDPDLLIGSWAPPVWYHTAKFGTTYTYAANALATGLMAGIGLFSGWIVGLLFRPNARPILILFSCTVFVSWISYSVSLGDSVVGARLPWSLYFWMNNILQAVGILVGGSRVDTGWDSAVRSRDDRSL